ncbi:DUF7093 family protein [Halorussus pelagicus]|uniref:DUF7093 family protein n=1 Tax=Halorussus pelagicus TaxID=2505977 RepID=UPI000FFC9263|nr:hypothetical protein [Halorussus pelagicus]
MAIRCSLLGHSYGETEIEREREEQGSEVVVTVREFEECERCGERKIVTENKEVTALQSPAPDLKAAESDADAESPSDASRGSGATGESRPTGGPGAGTGPSVESGPNAGAADSSVGSEIGAATDAEVTAAAGEDDAEILTDSSDSGASGGSPGRSPSDGASGSGGSSSGGPSADVEGDETTDAAESVEEASAADDDGVILDDDGEASDAEGRTPGEWPESETTHPAEADDGPGDWPAVGRKDADEGYDADPGDSEDADVQFGGGLTPESAPEVDDDETGEVEFVNAEGDALQSKDARRDGTELSSGISAGADAPSLSGPADDPDVDAEFVCPECDYRQAVAGSSLRAGDICPECARGYLAQE